MHAPPAEPHAGAAGAALVVGFGVVATGVDEVAGLGATEVAPPPAAPDDPLAELPPPLAGLGLELVPVPPGVTTGGVSVVTCPLAASVETPTASF